MNEGTFDDRLAAGKAKEAAIIEQLQRHFWSVIPATDEQDRVDKIDCFVRWKGVTYSVAVKWRDSGRDLGVAAVRPFVNTHLLYQQVAAGAVPWDRDAQHYADLYALGSDDGLVVVTGASVKRRVDTAIGRYAAMGRIVAPEYEIKIVEDKGASGYSSGQKKLIVYIRLDALERIDV